MNRAAVLLALAVAAIPASCLAQEPPEGSTEPIGPWAFTIALNDLSFGSFDGVTLSMRRQTRDHAAWRYGITLSSVFDESKRHDRFESPTSPAVAERLDDHRWDAGVELDVTRLTFPGARRQVRPYLGIGAFGSFRYSRERFRERLEPTGSGPSELRGEDRGTSWGVGLFGAFGVEWRVPPNVALHAEYGQGLRYRPSHHVADRRELDASGTTVRQNNVDENSRDVSFYARGSRAGVSIFF